MGGRLDRDAGAPDQDQLGRAQGQAVPGVHRQHRAHRRGGHVHPRRRKYGHDLPDEEPQEPR